MWRLLALLLGPASPASDPAPPAAAVDGPQAPVRTRVVVLVPHTPDRRVDDVVASVRAGLTDATVELVLVPESDAGASRLEHARAAATAHAAQGVFWLELADARAYAVYLWLPERAVALRRGVPEAADSVEVAIEAMGIIVRSGALALASGRELAMEAVDPAALEPVAAPAPAPAPVVVTPAAPPRPRARPWRLALAYEGLGLGRAMPWHSGGALELSRLVHRNVAIGLGYAVVAGPRLREPASLSIVRHELAVVAGFGGSVHARVALWGRVLPALELAQWRSSQRRGTRAAGKAALELLLRIGLTPRLGLDVGAGADVVFTAPPYVRCADGADACAGLGRQVVLQPWRVRPRARAGLSLAF
ncbi:MAG: hypothetical protein K1X88_22005 [Nannocystaceae bacterium]|nr:hypothetical protein [Nannocystaceae bacterium]